MSKGKNDHLFILARQLRDIVNDIAHSDECSLDHNGSCQAHSYFGEGECPHARAVKLMSEADAILGSDELDDMDVCQLSGQALLDALTEAYNKGHYKGWTFSEISRGGGVLPMTVYDHEKDDTPITKHQTVAMTSMSKGEIVNLTIATTTSEGTNLHEFLPA